MRMSSGMRNSLKALKKVKRLRMIWTGWEHDVVAARWAVAVWEEVASVRFRLVRA